MAIKTKSLGRLPYMFDLTYRRSIGALMATLMLAACQAAEVNDAIIPVEDQSAAATERPTAQEALANINASIEKAENTKGSGAPALWVLKDEDTTIHMFGTVHLLRPETEWRSPAFEAAFASADKLVLEADTTSPEAQASMAGLIPKYGIFQSGESLNDVIDDADEPIVEAALLTFGIPLAGMQVMKPWLVGLQMSVMQIQKAGFDPESGVEPILTAEAATANMSIGYLETAEDQISILAGGEMADQVESLIFASHTLEYGPKILDSLVSEWADGDVAGLGEIMAEPEAIGGEKAYEALLVNRNKNWVPQIKAMLDEPGTVFVAVGAAHLAGPDSVITMLRAEGFEISGPQ